MLSESSTEMRMDKSWKWTTLDKIVSFFFLQLNKTHIYLMYNATTKTATQNFQEWQWSLKTHIQTPWWVIEIRVDQKDSAPFYMFAWLFFMLYRTHLYFLWYTSSISSGVLLSTWCMGFHKSIQTSSSSYSTVAVSQILNLFSFRDGSTTDWYGEEYDG